MKRSKYNKGKKASAFITKLFSILENSENWELVRWTDDERSFHIVNIPQFSERVLSKYYKHSNFSSFVRQLHMYEFYKVRTELQGEHIFQHELFYKSNHQNFKDIRRKTILRPTKNSANPLAIDAQQQYSSGSSIMNQRQISFEQDMGISEESSEVCLFNESSVKRGNMESIFQSFHNISVCRSASEYLSQMEELNQSIPASVPDSFSSSNLPNISIPKEFVYNSELEALRQMKESQRQLEEICLSLYGQNQRLTSQNFRLQQKLGNQYTKKDMILNKIINYVIGYLWEWNGNGVGGVSRGHAEGMTFPDEQQSEEFGVQPMSQESAELVDPVLESYNKVQKDHKFSKKRHQGYNSQKVKRAKQQKHTPTAKYNEIQKQILHALIKEIDKSYSNIFSSSESFEKNNFDEGFHKGKGPQQTSASSSFLMSMLMKFIESNNLTEVVKRFSTLISLGRNQKSKNFTIVNCMKDLRQQFQHNALEMDIIDQHFGEVDSIDSKKVFLQSEKNSISEMERELAIMSTESQNCPFDQKDSLVDHFLTLSQNEKERRF